MAKLCKDCKHHNNGYCNAPQNIEISLVNGEKIYSGWPTCAAQRVGGPIADLFVSWGDCGWRGKWFEPKIKEA